MDPAERLREREHRLLTRYGGDHPPRSFDGENLESEDPNDAEHWVNVYTELAGFKHTLIESASQVLADQVTTGIGRPAKGLGGLRLQCKILELHLTYWTDRLNRLNHVNRPRGVPESGEDSPA